MNAFRGTILRAKTTVENMIVHRASGIIPLSRLVSRWLSILSRLLLRTQAAISRGRSAGVSKDSAKIEWEDCRWMAD